MEEAVAPEGPMEDASLRLAAEGIAVDPWLLLFSMSLRPNVSGEHSPPSAFAELSLGQPPMQQLLLSPALPFLQQQLRLTISGHRQFEISPHQTFP